MNIKLKPVISEKIWNDFVLLYGPQSLFQSWVWGEVEKKSGSEISRYGIYRETELIGVAQVLLVKAKRGTYLHIRQGPVFKVFTTEVLREVISLFRTIALRSHAWFVRLSPMVADTKLTQDIFLKVGLKHAPIHEVDAERCWVLDIDRPEEELLQGMRKTTRYEIRRGLKMDISITQSTSLGDLALFSDMYSETSKRHGFVSHGSVVEEFEQFIATDNAALFLGYFEKKLTATAIILFYGGQAIYHHGASIPCKAPVSYVLQWNAILEAKKRHLKYYNFYGIAPENKPHHPWNGLTLFKKGFGGHEMRYMHSHDFPLSPLYRIPHTIETIRTRLRGY